MARPDAQSCTNSTVDRWAALWGHRESLIALARTRMPVHDVEDVVHDAIILAANNPAVRLDTAGAWLNRVVTRRCADAARRRGLYKYNVAYAVLLSVSDPPVDEEICDRDEARHLKARIRSLPGRQREALLLLASGLPVPDIAARMSCSTKAVDHLIRKARATLCKRMLLPVLWIVTALGVIQRHLGAQVNTAVPALALTACVAMYSTVGTDDLTVASQPDHQHAHAPSVTGPDQTVRRELRRVPLNVNRKAAMEDSSVDTSHRVTMARSTHQEAPADDTLIDPVPELDADPPGLTIPVTVPPLPSVAVACASDSLSTESQQAAAEKVGSDVNELEVDIEKPGFQ